MVELDRYLDLFLSESQEALRRLNGHLLRLEEEEGDEALTEAFRAAHTLKGMAATMGLEEVATHAHQLEDELDALRGGEAVDAFTVDELFRHTDALEAAIGRVAAGAGSDPAAGPETTAVAVTLRADTELAAARAMMVVRKLAEVATVAGHEPARFDAPEFDGRFVVHVRGEADAATLERAVESAGEVERVVVERAGRAAAAAGGAVAEPVAPEPSFVRVERDLLERLVDGVTELAGLHRRMEDPYVLGRHEARTAASDRMRRLLARLGDVALRTRLVPVSQAFDRFPRLVRDLAREQGKDVEFSIRGRTIEIDRRILNEIAEPVVHLLRNAVDHGIEVPEARAAVGKPARARLSLRAEHEHSQVVITVEDDGRGIDVARVVRRAEAAGLVPAGEYGDPDALDERELLRLLAHAGLSTAERITAISGRGVGLDVVVSRVRALGGAVELWTGSDGTRFELRLPISRALMPAVRVRVGSESYVVPLTYVAEAVELESAPDPGTERLSVGDGTEPVRVLRLGEMLRAGTVDAERSGLVLQVGEERAVLLVDELVSREQVVVRDFEAPADALPVFSGVTLLDDGRPVLVVDPVAMI